MIDYHIHSTHSGDSPAALRDMCARAVEVGLTEIAFTEHLDFTPTDVSYGAFDYSTWMRELAAAREEFSGRLVIRAGVEVDYQARYHTQIEDFLQVHEFDYVLAAAHYVNGAILEEHTSYFPSKSARDAYAPYFDVALAAVETGLFDALAHIDLCKRHGVLYYGPFRLDDFLQEIDGILKAIVRRGMALEVNTSGLRQSPGEAYPSIDILRRYCELGGTIVTVGSDAHEVSQLGAHLPDALSIAREIGITQAARFEGGTRLADG